VKIALLDAPGRISHPCLDGGYVDAISCPLWPSLGIPEMVSEIVFGFLAALEIAYVH